jgi:hypothetical protein
MTYYQLLAKESALAFADVVNTGYLRITQKPLPVRGIFNLRRDDDEIRFDKSGGLSHGVPFRRGDGEDVDD